MNTNPAPQAASGPAPERTPAVPGWVQVFLTFLRLWSEFLLLLGPRATREQAALLPVIQALSDLLTQYVEGRLSPPASRGRATPRPYCARHPGAQLPATHPFRRALGPDRGPARASILTVPAARTPFSNFAALQAEPHCAHIIPFS